MLGAKREMESWHCFNLNPPLRASPIQSTRPFIWIRTERILPQPSTIWRIVGVFGEARDRKPDPTRVYRELPTG